MLFFQSLGHTAFLWLLSSNYSATNTGYEFAGICIETCRVFNSLVFKNSLKMR